MQTLPYHDVDYCMYGYPARKRTSIWTNYTGFVGKFCDKTCGAYGLKYDQEQGELTLSHYELPNTQRGARRARGENRRKSGLSL